MPRKKKRHRKKVRVGDTYKWISAYSKAELKEKEYALIAGYTPKPSPRVTVAIGTTPVVEPETIIYFEQYALKWFHLYKLNTLRASTQAMYLNLFNAHLFPAFGKHDITTITADALQAFFNTYIGKSKSTIDKLYVTFNQIFEKAVQQDILTKNPIVVVEKPKGTAKERKPVPYELIPRLVADLLAHKHGLLPMICLFAGLRRGEALALTAEDITQNRITINKALAYVRGKSIIGEPKTKAGYRTVPVAAVLQPLLADKQGYLFGDASPWNNSKYRRVWAALRNDIPLLREYSLHNLRHTFNMLMRRAGVDESTRQYLMGHDDFKTTAKTYTHIDANDILDADIKLKALPLQIGL